MAGSPTTSRTCRTRRARSRGLQLTVDPRDERAAIDLFGRAFGSLGTAFPRTELGLELREFLAEPEHADLFLEIGVLELGLQVRHHGLGARLRQLAVVLDGAFRRAARDDEEPARAALIGEHLIDDREVGRIELGLVLVELDD